MERTPADLVRNLREAEERYDLETFPWLNPLLVEAADLLQRAAVGASGLRPPEPGAEIPWPAGFPELWKPEGSRVLFHRVVSEAEREALSPQKHIAEAFLIREYNGYVRTFEWWPPRWDNTLSHEFVALLLSELGAARAELARLRGEVDALLAAANTRDADAVARAWVERQAQRHDPECFGCHVCCPWEFCGGTGTLTCEDPLDLETVGGTGWTANLAQNRWERRCTGCADCIGKENGPAPAPEPPGHPVEAMTHIVEFRPTLNPHRARVAVEQMLSRVPKGAFDTPKIALCPATLRALLQSGERGEPLTVEVYPEDREAFALALQEATQAHGVGYVRVHPGEPTGPTDDEDMPTRAFHAQQRRAQQALNRDKE